MVLFSVLGSGATIGLTLYLIVIFTRAFGIGFIFMFLASAGYILMALFLVSLIKKIILIIIN